MSAIQTAIPSGTLDIEMKDKGKGRAEDETMPENKTETAGESSQTPADTIAPSKPDDNDTTESQPAQQSNTIKISILTLSNKRKTFNVTKSLLRKANQLPDSEDPLEITVYTLKEIIWQGWEADWEAKPSGPAGIRLIHLGQMLTDNTPLKETRISRDTLNVMHITVKPQDPEENEEQTKNHARGNNATRPRSGGCCIIM